MILWGIFFFEKQDVFLLVFEMLAACEADEISILFF